MLIGTHAGSLASELAVSRIDVEHVPGLSLGSDEFKTLRQGITGKVMVTTERDGVCAAAAVTAAAPLSVIKARQGGALEQPTGFTGTQRHSTSLAESPFSLAHFAEVLRDPQPSKAAAGRSLPVGGHAKVDEATAPTVGQSRPPAGRQLPGSFRLSILDSELYSSAFLSCSAALPPQPRRASEGNPESALPEREGPDGRQVEDDPYAAGVQEKAAARLEALQRVGLPVTEAILASTVASSTNVRALEQKPVKGERSPSATTSTLKALSSALLRRASLPFSRPRSLKRQSGAPLHVERVKAPLVFNSKPGAHVPHPTGLLALPPQSDVEQLSSALSNINVSKDGCDSMPAGRAFGTAAATAPEAGSQTLKVRLISTEGNYPFLS